MQSRETIIRNFLLLGVLRSRVPEPTEPVIAKLAAGKIVPVDSDVLAGFVAQLSESHPFAKVWAEPIASRLLDQQERFAGAPVPSTRGGFDYFVGRWAASGSVEMLQQLIKIADGRGRRGSFKERSVSRDAAARLMDMAKFDRRFSKLLVDNGFDTFVAGELGSFSQTSDTVLKREAIAARFPLRPPADVEPPLAGRPFTLDRDAQAVRRRLGMVPPAKKEEL